MEFLKKGLFRLKQEQPDAAKPPEPGPVSVPETPKINYTEIGFFQARTNKGDPHALKININRLYHRYRDDIATTDDTQEKLKAPYRVQLKGLLAANENLKDNLEEVKNNKTPDIHEKIRLTRKRINDIRSNPQLVITESVNKAGLLVGALILLFLTIYLWVFYSSASYSAFFRDFDPSSLAIAHAIFDAKAVPKAYHEGITELILIIMMPFIFLALGFLIHKFSEKKSIGNYLKTAVLFAVTLLFDGLLAYEITGKIYDLKALGMFVSDLPAYSIAVAIKDINFWLIIFAGFVVYIVWGVVFSFVSEGYEKIDKVKYAIRTEEEKIRQLEAELVRLGQEADTIQAEIRKNNETIRKIEEVLNTTIINTREFKNLLYEFLVGWTDWLGHKHDQVMIREAHKIAETFLENCDKQLETINI